MKAKSKTADWEPSVLRTYRAHDFAYLVGISASSHATTRADLISVLQAELEVELALQARDAAALDAAANRLDAIGLRFERLDKRRCATIHRTRLNLRSMFSLLRSAYLEGAK